MFAASSVYTGRAVVVYTNLQVESDVEHGAAVVQQFALGAVRPRALHPPAARHEQPAHVRVHRQRCEHRTRDIGKRVFCEGKHDKINIENKKYNYH